MSDRVRVGIVGSRGWADLDRVGDYVRRLAEKHPEAVVVSGGARGVDQAAEEAARLLGLDVISFRPRGFQIAGSRVGYTIQTFTHGDEALRVVLDRGYRDDTSRFGSFAEAAKYRNGWIVQASDHIVVFWDGRSTGTRDSLEKAYIAGKPVHRQAA